MKLRTTSCGTATIRCGSNGLEVLLVRPRKENDVWGFPKGHLRDENETHEDAALRETFEETGVEVNLHPHLLGTADVVNKHEHKTVLIYIASPLDETAEPSPRDGENYQVQWWSVDALPSFHRYQQKLVEHLIEYCDKLMS